MAIPPILRPARRCFCMEHSLNGGGKHDAAKIVDGMDQLKMNGNGGKLNARDDSNGITLSETTKPINKSKVVGIGRLEDGTFGPTGIYGGWVGRSRMLDLFRQTLKISRLERIEKVLKQRCSRVQCVFENLHDAANGAACMRTMESFGLQYCHAIESYDPFDVNTGVAMAADKWMTVTRYKNCFEASDRLKEQGFTLIAVSLFDGIGVLLSPCQNSSIKPHQQNECTDHRKLFYSLLSFCSVHRLAWMKTQYQLTKLTFRP